MEISEISELTSASPHPSFTLHRLSETANMPLIQARDLMAPPHGGLDALDASPIRVPDFSPPLRNTTVYNHRESLTTPPPDVAPDDNTTSSTPIPPAVVRPASVRPRWTVKDFDFGKKIGEGRFGKIYLARVKVTGHVVALKVMSKDFIVAQDLVLQLKREINVQQHCRHNNVLRLFAWFWDDTRVYLVLEYASGGTLGDMIVARTTVPEPEAARYVADVAMALRYLHSRNIAHRDIKLENLLLAAGGRVKVADFTWAVYCGAGPRARSMRNTLCGTLDYLAPEMFSKVDSTGTSTPEYDTSVDMWSLGVVLYELLTGRAPFESQEPKDTVRRIQDEGVEVPAGVSGPCAELILLLLNKDRARRIRAQDVLAHPWVTGHVGFVGLSDKENIEFDRE